MASCTEGDADGRGIGVVGEGVSRIGAFGTFDGAEGKGGGTRERTANNIVTTNAVAASKGNGCPIHKGEPDGVVGVGGVEERGDLRDCNNRALPNRAGS